MGLEAPKFTPHGRWRRKLKKVPPPANNAEVDGISQVRQGMNSGIAPRLVGKDQVAFAINCTFRGGLPKTRPVWRKVSLFFNDAATQSNARAALFQDALGYQAYGSGENCILASIGGRMFRYLVGPGQNATVGDISISLTAVVGGGGFTVPAVGATVSVTLSSTTGWLAGMPVIVGAANYTVASVTSGTVLVLTNVDGVPAATVASGSVATVFTDLNDSTNPNAWMWQAEDFLITNNGAANPLFFDGAKLRRSLGLGGEELPPGCQGCYVQGRNWMVLPADNNLPSQAYIAGDLVYSHGFDGPYNGRQAVLNATELSLFSGGAPFSVPVSAGPITGMGTTAVMDTSLGQGSLQVMTRNSVFSVNVPLDRATWFSSQSPLVVVSLPNYGTVGQWALVTVNGDLWYRSLDGLRSLQVGRRDQGTWVNTPLSVEMEKVISRDTEQLLGMTSGVLFNNRLLMTCAPRFIRSRGTASWGMVALDFNNISNLNAQLGPRSNPAYDGLWTGLHILKLVKATLAGFERCFAFALDCDGNIGLWELMRDEVGYFDFDGTQTVGIESSFETRSMGWIDNGNALKRLLCADLYLDRVAGNDTVDLNFKYRSDEDTLWKDWHSFQLCAPIQDCTTSDCPTFQNVQEQYRTYIRLPDPRDNPCSPVTKRSPRTGYEFQTRMWWKGFLQLNRLHEWAQPMNDSVVKGCPTSENCVLVKGCDLPWFDYSIEGCPGNPNVPYPVPPGPPPTPPTPPEPPPPPNTPPVWPVPDPYTCEGRTTSLPIVIYDPVAQISTYVGIAPTVPNPIDYIKGILGDAQGEACIVAWSNAVWADFLTTGTPYSQVRLIWSEVSTSNKSFQGWSVFPSQLGDYFQAIDLSTRILVEFCP